MILEWLRRLFRMGAPAGAGGPGTVLIAQRRLTWRPASGPAMTLDLDALSRIDILTNATGPWADEIYYVLRSADCTLAIPASAAGMEELLKELQALADFDRETVAVAMSTTGDGRFPVWRRREQAA